MDLLPLHINSNQNRLTNFKQVYYNGFGFGSVIGPNKLVFNNEQIQFQVNKSKSAHAIGNSSYVCGFWTVGTLRANHM
jgi:hypothetical protein